MGVTDGGPDVRPGYNPNKEAQEEQEERGNPSCKLCQQADQQRQRIAELRRDMWMFYGFTIIMVIVAAMLQDKPIMRLACFLGAGVFCVGALLQHVRLRDLRQNLRDLYCFLSSDQKVWHVHAVDHDLPSVYLHVQPLSGNSLFISDRLSTWRLESVKHFLMGLVSHGNNNASVVDVLRLADAGEGRIAALPLHAWSIVQTYGSVHQMSLGALKVYGPGSIPAVVAEVLLGQMEQFGESHPSEVAAVHRKVITAMCEVSWHELTYPDTITQAVNICERFQSEFERKLKTTREKSRAGSAAKQNPRQPPPPP